ncbi:uncharacterized protein LOC124490356 [Dermatophagoides farinae]|uniref:uncharacterized protein LOC124490356 n=1 Tax=Dermatophagoides farinae TaxID=6954 RepID=UPI003F5EAF89
MKQKKLSIFRLLQERELGNYHQSPWLFQEHVQKSLIRMPGHYKFSKKQQYYSLIVVDDLSIYSNRMAERYTLTKNPNNNDIQLQPLYPSTTTTQQSFPYKRFLDYILITSLLWSCDKVPLPKQDFLDGFYCLVLKRIPELNTMSTILYIQSHRTGEILQSLPLTIDSNRQHNFRELEYDFNNQQLIIHTRSTQILSKRLLSTTQTIITFSLIIFKLFPFRLRTFIDFTRKATGHITKWMISIQNNLLMFITAKNTFSIYDLDEILKLNGYDPSTLMNIDYQQQQFLKPNCCVQQMPTCLYRFKCDHIEFIPPIPWLFFAQIQRSGFSCYYVYEFPKTGEHYRGYRQYLFDDSPSLNAELFEQQIYFDGIQRLIYYVTSGYLAIYRHHPHDIQRIYVVPKEIDMEKIQKIKVSELRMNNYNDNFEQTESSSSSLSIIMSDYLDQLDTMLLLTIDVNHSNSMQLHIVNDLSSSTITTIKTSQIRHIELKEIEYFEDHEYKIHWRNNFLIMISERRQYTQCLYVYQFESDSIINQ